MSLRDRLAISDYTKQLLTRLMEYVLVGLFFIGLDRRNVGIVVNSGVALAVVQLPPWLERDFDIPMNPLLTLWITAAAFLHALGTVGIPGTALGSLYQNVWWWDHLTHALSSSVVAAAGYATVRAIDRHSDLVYLPPRFVFVFILCFTVAFGVAWEVIEFTIGGVSASLGGSVLTQYGLEDTMMDLLFDVVGGLLVAVWGTAYLSDVAGALSDRMSRRTTD